MELILVGVARSRLLADSGLSVIHPNALTVIATSRALFATMVVDWQEALAEAIADHGLAYAPRHPGPRKPRKVPRRESES